MQRVISIGIHYHNVMVYMREQLLCVRDDSNAWHATISTLKIKQLQSLSASRREIRVLSFKLNLNFRYIISFLFTWWLGLVIMPNYDWMPMQSSCMGDSWFKSDWIAIIWEPNCFTIFEVFISITLVKKLRTASLASAQPRDLLNRINHFLYAKSLKNFIWFIHFKGDLHQLHW